jgi:hypothetical protein
MHWLLPEVIAAFTHFGTSSQTCLPACMPDPTLTSLPAFLSGHAPQPGACPGQQLLCSAGAASATPQSCAQGERRPAWWAGQAAATGVSGLACQQAGAHRCAQQPCKQLTLHNCLVTSNDGTASRSGWGSTGRPSLIVRCSRGCSHQLPRHAPGVLHRSPWFLPGRVAESRHRRQPAAPEPAAAAGWQCIPQCCWERRRRPQGWTLRPCPRRG